ncbi:hypothetical protein K488DRAFT_76721 [Vararia minispora EC-137]|uniref:Uncharacterized protein n=1 Tax=Vararia minispora EC-137 TaxID=1314806 RepID=A0ACB8QTS3_9AGAM|nr:hypothetical protein K488DRAFT_76721 [Vararia minispora EC-137]
MASIRRISINPPLINSSCPWASELDQLQALFDCPYTGAVTTRTATLTGFAESAEHGVVFTSDTVSSQNSYGYSPHPLAWYIDAVRSILARSPDSKKPIIISITSSSPVSLDTMLSMIRALRTELGDATCETSRIAVELNTSCPNIQGSPPPAYTPAALAPLLSVLARHFTADPTFALGIKLPPYTYSTQFSGLLSALTDVLQPNPDGSSRRLSPIAFITSTNTLGQTLLFDTQIQQSNLKTSQVPFALPTPLGGLAGDSIHSLSLGNVYTLRRMLNEHGELSMHEIAIIGVGGVTSRDAHRRMREVGASVVACATYLGHEGVRAFELLSLNDK